MPQVSIAGATVEIALCALSDLLASAALGGLALALVVKREDGVVVARMRRGEKVGAVRGNQVGRAAACTDEARELLPDRFAWEGAPAVRVLHAETILPRPASDIERGSKLGLFHLVVAEDDLTTEKKMARGRAHWSINRPTCLTVSLEY